jgi:flavin-binding protein dodecin
MSVAKTIEITSTSPDSFEAAVRIGIERASKTVKHIKSAWVQDQEVGVLNGEVTSYQVRMKVTFVLED